jgi:hypothetical protein
MKLEFEYQASGHRYRCSAERRDRPWGHGLSVSRFDQSGRLVDFSHWVCHPEFEDYEEFQAKTSEQLVEWIAQELGSGAHESRLQEAREHGLTLMFVLTDKHEPTRRAPATS